MRSQVDKKKRLRSLFFDAAFQFVNQLARLALLSLTGLILVEVCLRSVFDLSLGFAEEISAYLVVVLTVFGGAISLRSGHLFRVRVLIDRFTFSVRKNLEILFYLIALVTCLILVWKMAGFTLSSFERGKFAATVLRTPLWIPQIAMPLGFSLISIFIVEKLLKLHRAEDDS
ncbi:MAG: TRAP transporter small permease [Gammaproteobacteria bacterium]